MYVDKVRSGIKAVQTLSRLNRAHPKKHDVFVLDFQNDTDVIEKSFSDYFVQRSLAKKLILMSAPDQARRGWQRRDPRG